MARHRQSIGKVLARHNQGTIKALAMRCQGTDNKEMARQWQGISKALFYKARAAGIIDRC
eukprot:scaffold13285_cov36-Cyclotella_meneghiniana.AAC.4